MIDFNTTKLRVPNRSQAHRDGLNQPLFSIQFTWLQDEDCHQRESIISNISNSYFYIHNNPMR